ncbi:MAG: DNA cytosine methyltransferase [FCB group bacterium]|nr:DNA cytosine methyltransferase [FCB group bacterium]
MALPAGQFTAISLCTGYDGIGLGLKTVIPGFRTVAYVEREAFAVCNLVAKIQAKQLDDAPIWSDVATFDGREFAGLVDLVHGGIPCQPWSCAGQRKGTSDERWIWPDVFRIVKEVGPAFVFLEEVPGFVVGGGLGYVLSDLAQAGYDAQWDMFTAAETGAPHKRQRLFILAHASRQLLHRRRDAGAAGRRKYSDGDQELADAGGERLQRRQRPETYGRGRPSAHGPVAQRREVWPARPGQRQYDWEPPRTVATKCAMDRDFNGPARRLVRSTSRTDELRLLGNGVVPQVAALAWTVLSERINTVDL